MRPVLESFAEKRICYSKDYVWQCITIAGSDVFKVRIVNGVERAIIGAEGKRVYDAGLKMPISFLRL